MYNEPLSLVFANSGTIPSDDGVAYCIRDGLKRDVFLWKVEGYNDSEGAVPVYTLSDYPDDDVFDGIKECYAGEDWFDEQQLDEYLSEGYDVDKVVICIENHYKLPYQELYYENGRILAHDEETGRDRELVRVRLKYKNDKYSNICSFMMLAPGQDMNIAQFTSIICGLDSKVPKNLRDHLNRVREFIMENGDNDLEVKVEDVYVLRP